MYPSEQDVRDVIDLVSCAYFEGPAAPIAAPGGDAPWADAPWTGCVIIDGSFRGAVTLACRRAFADLAARAMGVTTDDAVTDDAAVDVLAELTNELGGNIKAMLADPTGAPCHLSLPFVSRGAMKIPGARALHELWSELGGERVVLTLYEELP